MCIRDSYFASYLWKVKHVASGLHNTMFMTWADVWQPSHHTHLIWADVWLPSHHILTTFTDLCSSAFAPRHLRFVDLWLHATLTWHELLYKMLLFTSHLALMIQILLFTVSNTATTEQTDLHQYSEISNRDHCPHLQYIVRTPHFFWVHSSETS